MDWNKFIEEQSSFWEYENGKVPQKPQTREVLHNSSSAANIEQPNPQLSPQTTHSVENVEKFIDEMKMQDAKIKKKHSK